VILAGYFGVNPPGFVAQTVAFAFGLAAASFFPAIVMGIFSKRMNAEGAISGMIAGVVFTAGYIAWFTYLSPETNNPDGWWFGISPEGIGTVGMLVNVAVAMLISRKTPAPEPHIQEMVERIRVPK
jgi:cation/acetate symporter